MCARACVCAHVCAFPCMFVHMCVLAVYMRLRLAHAYLSNLCDRPAIIVVRFHEKIKCVDKVRI